MSALNHSHQDQLFNPKNSRPVTLLGAGSVGSQVALMLGRMGVPRLTIYDGDDVRSHNLPMTLAFRPNDLSRFKAEVIGERAREETGMNVEAITRMYDGSEPFKAGSVVTCVDTMAARAAIWERARHNPNVDLLVDTRVHERFLSVFAINPTDPRHVKLYEKHLYPDSSTPRRMCGRHGVIYVTSMAAALAVRALTGFWEGATPKRHERLLLGNQGTHLEAS